MKFKSGEEFVKNLVSQYCPEPTVSSSIRLETYYKKAHTLFYSALDFVKAKNDARSYVELMRYCQLIANLSNHNSYNAKQYEKDKNLNKRRLNNAITKLEELKPRLISAYNNEIKKEQERLLAPQQEEEEEQQQPQQQQQQENIEEKEEKKQESSSTNKNNENRWNNLKIPSAPPSSSSSSSSSKQITKTTTTSSSALDAIFKKPSADLTPIFIANNVVSDFIKYASNNTKRDIETCGVLTGKYLHDQDAYLITHVIIPKQKGSANTVQTLHEEELIGIQEKYGIITLGWIHSHPSQTCFLSSVDLHCQLSYQIMMPNAIAIVYAPTDKTLVFSLTKKGVNLLSKCSCKGFHRHDGITGIYKQATHTHNADHQKCKFIDLRTNK